MSRHILSRMSFQLRHDLCAANFLNRRQRMHPIKKTFSTVFSRLLGNRLAQCVLQRVVVYANYFMGIGSGAHTDSSGEIRVLHRLAQYGNPPYVIFDVGANRGQFLDLVMCEINAALREIHCFEPGRAAYAALQRSFANTRDVYLNNVGLGEAQGRAKLYYDEPGSGLASLTKRRLDHFGIFHLSEENVSIDTIDDYCAAKGIREITLLKIDVEGHELDVLKGARRMFSNNAIAAVVFEFGGGNIDTRTYMQDYWYFFKEAKMKLFRITPGGYLFPIHSYSEVMEQMVTTNFVANRLGMSRLQDL